jgi:hypothetical protein
MLWGRGSLRLKQLINRQGDLLASEQGTAHLGEQQQQAQRRRPWR